jgi:hypothetical protein
MNASQQHYYAQVVSDLGAFDALSGESPCHRLHYLQMLTEKLAKAYLFGRADPVTKQHTGFERFIKDLRREPRIAKEFSFSRRMDFVNYLQSVLPLVREIERLAPALCEDGPNPEYPWPPPPRPPTAAPATFAFPLWRKLQAPQGAKFLRFLRRLIEKFPSRF